MRPEGVDQLRRVPADQLLGVTLRVTALAHQMVHDVFSEAPDGRLRGLAAIVTARTVTPLNDVLSTGSQLPPAAGNGLDKSHTDQPAGHPGCCGTTEHSLAPDVSVRGDVLDALPLRLRQFNDVPLPHDGARGLDGSTWRSLPHATCLRAHAKT